ALSAAVASERHAVDVGVDRRLVGSDGHVDLRRHPMELLFPARALVPLPEGSERALDPLWTADDRTDAPSLDPRHGRRGLSVATRSRGAAGGATVGCAADGLQVRDAAGRRAARAGGD